MTVYITDATVEGYAPGSSEPDYTIPGDHIHSFDAEQKVGDIKDTGKLSIDNKNDRYTNLIDHGHRFTIKIQGEGLYDPSKFGEGSFGEGLFGGSESGVWTGIVRDISYTYEGASECTLDIDAQDFVFGVMDFRTVYNEWDNRQIVGSNGIVNEILMDNCPEIDRSQLPDRDETTTLGVQGKSVMKVIGELALRIPAIPYSVGDRLLLSHPDTLSPELDLQPSDYGVPEIGSQDQNMRTSVRVRGGTSQSIDDAQTTQDGTVTVTESNRATQRIETRKSYVSQVDLYTVADRTGEDIILRLQKDVGDGSGPIAPGDEESDIASRRLSAEFLDDNGYTLFNLPSNQENILPEPNPWMIIETDGDTGQDIGSNTATGEVAFKAYYPYPIILVQERASASEQYRLREGEVVNSTIDSFEEAKARSDSFLNEHSTPTETIQMDAQSKRLHMHDLGASVQVTNQEAVNGAFVAVEKKDHYEGNQLTTEFSFQSLASI